jgi:hypothetical protein
VRLQPRPCHPYYIGPNGCDLPGCKYSHSHKLNDIHLAVLRQFSKKILCQYFKSSGRCIYGDNCMRGHECPKNDGGKCGDQECKLLHPVAGSHVY